MLHRPLKRPISSPKAYLAPLLALLTLMSYAHLSWLSWDPEASSLLLLAHIGLLVGLWSIGLYLEHRYAIFDHTPLWLWTLLIHLCAWLGAPLFEDDYFRYLWDGYQLVTQGTPYATAPADHFTDPSLSSEWQAILDHINYPNVPTIYGPVTEYLFGLAYIIAPASLWGLKWVFMAFNIALLIWLYPRVSRTLWYAYAWCPLLLKEAVYTLHADIAAIALLCWGLSAWQQRQFYRMALLLALACAAKWVMILVAGLVLLRSHWRSWLVFVITLLACYLPLTWQGVSELQGLRQFAAYWQFNSSLFALSTLWLTPEQGKLLLGALFASGYLYYAYHFYQRTDCHLPRGDLVFGGLLLCAPVVNPWYFLWALPFVALYPRAWSLCACAALLLSYIHGVYWPAPGLAPYQQPLWSWGLEYGLIALAALLGHYRRHSAQPLR